MFFKSSRWDKEVPAPEFQNMMRALALFGLLLLAWGRKLQIDTYYALIMA